MSINQQMRLDPLLMILLKEARSLFPEVEYIKYWRYDNEADVFHLLSAEPSVTEEGLMSRNDLLLRYVNKGRMAAENIFLVQSDEDPAKCLLVMNMIWDNKLAGYWVFENVTISNPFDNYCYQVFERFRAYALLVIGKA